jgi:glyoxylase-like metal-dependent hydrolase (beta-lactamase superfamily II)
LELYAIRFCENFANATYESVYRDIGNFDKVPGFIYLYYLAKYNGRVILFDTGFRDKETASKMGITLIDVENEIKNIIGDPDCVDMVVITHSHFDHIGNLDLYKKSTKFISKLEYDFALKERPEPVKTLLKTNDFITIEDEYIFDNKFRFKVIGGHTLGSSVIYFEEGKKRYVIAGDECYMIDNILKNIPSGFYTDTQKNEDFISDAHNKRLIPLPYHDDKVFSNYEQISKNIVKII